MLHRSLHLHGIVPRPLLARHPRLFTQQVLQRQAFPRLPDIGERAQEDDFAAMDAGLRPHVDEHVRGADDFLVMLDDDDRIADVPQALEHADQPVGIPRMQADGGLVEDVHGADERAAEGGDEVDALAFAAGKGVAGAAEREVRQTDVLDVAQAGGYLLDGFVGDAVLVRGQFEAADEGEELVDIHLHPLVDGLAADLDIEGLGAKARSAAAVADRPAAVAAEHVFILDLVAVALDPVEEFVDADQGAVVALDAVRVPDEVALVLRDLAPGLENGDAVFRRHFDEMVLEPAHLLAAPAGDRPVVDALGLVRDDKVLADADDLAQAAADRAGAERAVEAEKILVRLAEADPVLLHPFGEFLQSLLGRPGPHAPVAPGERCSDGIPEPRLEILRPQRELGAVDQQHQMLGEVAAVGMEHNILDAGHGACVSIEEAGIALLLQREKELGPVLGMAFPGDIREDVDAVEAAPGDIPDNVAGALPADLFAADGGIGPADAGEDELEVVVDFGRCRDGRTGVLDVDLLLDGDGRGDALDELDIGLGHASEELPGIGREALGEAALPLRKERVKGQRGLAAAGNAGDDDKFPARNLQRNVLEVVDLRPPDDDISFLWHGRGYLRWRRFQSFGLSW